MSSPDPAAAFRSDLEGKPAALLRLAASLPGADIIVRYAGDEDSGGGAGHGIPRRGAGGGRDVDTIGAVSPTDDPGRREPVSEPMTGRSMPGVRVPFAEAILLFPAVLLVMAMRSGLPWAPIGEPPRYFDFAGRILGGLVPYRDAPLEYPPLALVPWVLPRLLTERRVQLRLAAGRPERRPGSGHRRVPRLARPTRLVRGPATTVLATGAAAAARRRPCRGLAVRPAAGPARGPRPGRRRPRPSGRGGRPAGARRAGQGVPGRAHPGPRPVVPRRWPSARQPAGWRSRPW